MLQTGRYPTHSGIVLNWIDVNPNQRCIAHVFRDAGYSTGFIGKWHLAKGHFKGTHGRWPFNLSKPMDEYIPPGPKRLGYDHWEAFNFNPTFHNTMYFGDDPEPRYMDGYETDCEISMAIRHMDRCHREDRPFFLMVAPHPPHPPWNPDACPEGYLENIPEKLDWRPNVPLDQSCRSDSLAARCYYAMAKNVDDNVGRIIEFLDKSGLAEDTIVVFTSDHGEMMGSHDRFNKMVPYAEAVNIPMIMRWPGRIPAGAETPVLHTPIDHMPTLCALAGLEPPAAADGKDLGRTVLGTGGVEREAVLMANYTSHWDYFETGTLWPEWRGVKTRRYTYVKWFKDGVEELYDNQNDPYQMQNLAIGSESAPLLEEMRLHLLRLMAEAHDEFLPGNAYADWFDSERNLVKTALGPV